MRTDARFYRWSDPQGLMNSREVVVHVKQRDHCDMVLKFLRERVGQARKAAHIHSHVQVLALHIRRADVVTVRIADDVHAFGAQTLSGLVDDCQSASFRSLIRVSQPITNKCQ